MSHKPKVREGDIGTTFQIRVIRAGAALSISDATTKEIRFLKSDGSALTKTATFTTDGTDGYIEYTTVSGDLTPSGEWEIDARVVRPSGTWSTRRGKFEVEETVVS